MLHRLEEFSHLAQNADGGTVVRTAIGKLRRLPIAVRTGALQRLESSKRSRKNVTASRSAQPPGERFRSMN